MGSLEAFLGKLPSLFEWSTCRYCSSPDCRCGDKIQSNDCFVKFDIVKLLQVNKPRLRMAQEGH